MNWLSDETMMLQRMREIQQRADRAQALGLYHREESPAWPGLRTRLGHWLIALGQYLQHGDENRRSALRVSSQRGLR